MDEYCKKNNIGNIDIIKIDTQGYEDKVLKGCSELIKNDKINLIQVELIFADIYEKSLNFYDIERYLIPNNFRLFAINNFGSLYNNYSWQTELIYVHKNLYNEYLNL